MADRPLKVDRLDQHGVIVDANALTAPRGSFSKAQNAVPDPAGEAGSIRKRPGWKRFNESAGAGAVRGGVSVPLMVGSAGPSFANPFTDLTALTIDTYTAPTYEGSTVRLGPVFNDEGFWDSYDWLGDFDEQPNSTGLPDADAPDSWLVAGDQDALQGQLTYPAGAVGGTSTLKTGSVPVPVTLLGEVTGNWFLFLNDTLTEHTNSEDDTYTNAKTLVFPTGSVRAYNAAGAGTGGASDANYPLAGWYDGTVASREDGYPICVLNNVMYYVGGYTDYTVGTDAPVLRAYDGYSDRIVLRLPKNPDVSATAHPKAIVSVLAANSRVYMTTYDGGTNGASGGTIKGSVYEFNPATGALTKLGATFPTGHLPYCLLWAYGMLWCGTGINQLDDNTAARVYRIRPGVETAWTLDKTFATDEGICTALAVFQGKIYATTLFTDNVGSATANLYTRTPAGTWSASDTGTTEVAVAGYLDLRVWPPENGPVTSPTPALYAVRTRIDGDANQGALRKFDGSSWSTVATWDFDTSGAGYLTPSYVISSGTIKPALWVMRGADQILGSTDGTTFTDRGAQLLPNEDDTGVGAMGSLIIQI